LRIKNQRRHLKKDLEWLQLQQKQRCVNPRNLQHGTGTDVACVEDRAAITGTSGFAEYVCANLRITAKYRALQNQAGNNF
jgi:hypothetical protein